MTDRALLVLDQVSHGALAAELTRRGLVAPPAVTLDYIPRTTPVGHATISTGHPPASHRIQGRTWYEHGPTLLQKHDVAGVVTLTRPTSPSPLQIIGSHSLAARLRNMDVNGIVAVAAKDFIPFLFGAWDCDVIIYPFDVAPGPIATQGGALGLSIVFVAWTTAGGHALQTVWPSIAATLTQMAPPGAITLAPTPSAAATWPQVHTVNWLLPTAWGTARLNWAPHWRSYLLARADAIDDGYASIAQYVLGKLPAPRAHLQSCFSTDAHGHASGPSSAAYASSVASGVSRALRLVGAGFTVAVTSDHGGRDTPQVTGYDRIASTIGGQALPAAGVHFKDGDHVVGYTLGAGGTSFWVSAGAGLSPFTVPSTMTVRSHHPSQTPTWRVVGDLTTRVAEVGARPGGGDHGLCEDGGAIASVDDVVAAWSPNGRSTHVPSKLDDIADWFLNLT